MGYLERLESYKEDMLRTLKESVAFPSVKADPVKTAYGDILPFGRGVHDALIHMLGVGTQMGFESNNVERAIGGYYDESIVNTFFQCFFTFRTFNSVIVYKT